MHSGTFRVLFDKYFLSSQYEEGYKQLMKIANSFTEHEFEEKMTYIVLAMWLRLLEGYFESVRSECLNYKHAYGIELQGSKWILASLNVLHI